MKYTLPKASSVLVKVLLLAITQQKLHEVYAIAGEEEVDEAFDEEIQCLAEYLKTLLSGSLQTKRVLCKNSPKKLIATLTREGISVWCMYERVAEMVSKEECLEFWGQFHDETKK